MSKTKAIGEAKIRELSGDLKLLAGSSQMMILEAIRGGTARVVDICREISLEQPLVSHHLQLLRAGGMVARERDGVAANYALTAKGRLYYESIMSLSGVCQ